MEKQRTKCDFCVYHTASGCNAKPDSYYCQPALNEFYAWLREQKNKKGNRK